MDNQNDRDIYVIPPNFVDTGTFFGGMFKARNVIEAGILAGGTGIPIFLFLPAGLTVRVIVLCLTSLPLGLFALIGISGESLTSFLAIFLKYLRNRRVVGGDKEEAQGQKGKSRRTKPQGAGSQDGDCQIDGRKSRQKDGRDSPQRNRQGTGRAGDHQEMCGEAHPERRQVIARGHTSGRNNSKDSIDRKNISGKNSKGNIGGISGWRRTGEEDFPEEFDQIKGYEIRQKLRPSQGRRNHEEWDGKLDRTQNGGTESLGDKRQDGRCRRVGDVGKRAGQGNSDRQEKPSGQANAGRHGKANIQVNAGRYGKTNRQAEVGRQGKPGRQAGAEICHNEGRDRYTKDAGKMQKKNARSQNQDRAKHQSSAKAKHQPQAFRNPLAEYLPISKVENGMIYTKDHRYVKVVEVVPINFLLRSAREQRGIIYSFVSYLCCAPFSMTCSYPG